MRYAATATLIAATLFAPSAAHADSTIVLHGQRFQVLHHGSLGSAAQTISGVLDTVGDTTHEVTCTPWARRVEAWDIGWEVLLNLTTRELVYRWIGRGSAGVNGCASSITVLGQVIDQPVVGRGVTEPGPIVTATKTANSAGEAGTTVYNDELEVPYYDPAGVGTRSEILGSVTVKIDSTYVDRETGTPQPVGCTLRTHYFTPTPAGPRENGFMPPTEASC